MTPKFQIYIYEFMNTGNMNIFGVRLYNSLVHSVSIIMRYLNINLAMSVDSSI